MRVLFVTPEVTPYSGVSPTGDACWALPKALKGRGHEVTILSPLYGFIDPSARSLARRLRKIEVELEGGRTPFQLFDARTAAGVDMLFLRHEELFGPVQQLPLGSTAPGDMADGVRFGAFCKAAIEVLRSDEAGFDVVHCHDWQTALVPVLVDLLELETGTVFTVHDVDRLGLFPPQLMRELDLPERLFGIDGLEFYGKVSFLKGAALEADRVTTVSPTYAREIVEDDGAHGLEGVFRRRDKELVGIVGGVDVAVWNPATDAHLEVRFDPMDLSGKRRCKAAMQDDLGFPVRDDVPLIACFGPLHPSSGLDVLARVISRIMRNDVQLLIAAGEDPTEESLVTVLEEHAKRWPDRLAVKAAADIGLVHRALGAADAVLVPPRQPPGGSQQLRAHRYGALPIGPRAGAVADTVVDCDPALQSGSGFLYDSGDDEQVLAAVQRTVSAYANRSAFERVRRHALRTDHSWDRSAYLYERLYESI